MPNPYDPQRPIPPDLFVGRDKIIRTARDLVTVSKRTRSSHALLVYGHRGVGKTSTILKIKAEVELLAPSHISLYIQFPPERQISEEELYQRITEMLVAELEKRKSIFENVLDRIKELNLGAAKVSFEKATSQYTWHMKLAIIMDQLRDLELLHIALDDADSLDKGALNVLKRTIETPAAVPVFLVVSGGIDFEQTLTSAFSPIARIFSGASFDITSFSEDETKELVVRLLRESDGENRWTEEALQQVCALSRGYPYLVQCIARASYRPSGEITRSIVDASIKDALDIGRPWLARELRGASDNDIIFFAKISQLNTPVFRSSEMGHLGVSPPYIGRLASLGVIKKISRGRYELVKAPIIAYYHLLARNISDVD